MLRTTRCNEIEINDAKILLEELTQLYCSLKAGVIKWKNRVKDPNSPKVKLSLSELLVATIFAMDKNFILVSLNRTNE